ncbi:MAG: hypothetical protein ACNI28_09155 [Arcobacter sp.]|uniref:hypothetical protein n=1 Tax=Arcobacter sp. TaxID=1872629 RepID=UPI003B00C3EF
MEIIYLHEIFNYFLHYIKNINIFFFFFVFIFYKTFYERIIYANIFILYIIFPTLIFFGKYTNSYIASFIEQEYINLYLKITTFLIFNFIVFISWRFIKDWKEHFLNLWDLMKFLFKVFSFIWIYKPKQIKQPLQQANRQTITNQTQVKKQVSQPQTKPTQKKPNKLKISKRKILDSFEVYTQSNIKIELYDDNKKRGGEALVYDVKGSRSLAKIFHKGNIDLNYKENVVKQLQKLYFSKSIVTPKEILYDGNNSFIGYSMPKKKGVELGKLLIAKVTDFFPNYTLIDTLDIAISITKIFEETKDKKVIVGDVNPRNILVANKDEVYLIDTDSFQVGNKPSLAFMEEYRRPKYRGINIQNYLRIYKDDCFAVATIIFQLLHYGLLPYGGNDEKSLQDSLYIFNPFYPEKNIVTQQVLIKAHNRLSTDLKLTFRDIFKNDKSVLISTLKKHLLTYRNMLLEVQKNRGD